jgi:hypothetical protein
VSTGEPSAVAFAVDLLVESVLPPDFLTPPLLEAFSRNLEPDFLLLIRSLMDSIRPPALHVCPVCDVDVSRSKLLPFFFFGDSLPQAVLCEDPGRSRMTYKIYIEEKIKITMLDKIKKNFYFFT